MTPIFFSPRGLYPFQAEITAKCVLRPANLVAADTGLGKTVITLASLGILFEDDQIDIVLCLVEKNKVDEWIGDFADFTPSLDVLKYRGAKTTRANKLRKNPDARVILTTHEMGRSDLVEGPKHAWTPGPLLRHLMGKRVMVVMDEMTVYGGLDSGLHNVMQYALGQLPGVRKLGLTGTPLTSSPVSYYALGRILCPQRMQSRETFYDDHVLGFNGYGQPTGFRNLELLAQRMDDVLIRKRKTDPDVRDQFPDAVEKFVYTGLDPDHLDEYEKLADLSDQLRDPRMANTTLRQFANHPGSLLESESKLAELYFEAYGDTAVRRLSGAKSAAIISDLRSLLSAGEQVLVFNNSTKVLRAFSTDLLAARIQHGLYMGTGNQAESEREYAKAAFKRGDIRVLLLTAAGERGMNLPEAGAVINYDVPPLFSSYIQRMNRASRIGARDGGVLYVKTYASLGTVEEATVRAWNQRNAWSDQVIDHDVAADDEVFLSAEDRAAMLKAARAQHKE